MSSRVATMTIFIEEKENVSRVNDILNDYSDIIVGRMGIPYRGNRITSYNVCYTKLLRDALKSVQVEPVQVHHPGPCRHEIVYELLL